MKGHAICDGRGNMGTGARAAVLTLENGEVYEKAEKIPPTTNIVAEHLAIQLAMELALEHGVTDLLIWNDSQTPVNHVLGKFKIEKPHIKPIVEKTWELGKSFEHLVLAWVPREKTKAPDLLCRRVDRKKAARPRPPVLAAKKDIPQRKNPFVRYSA